MGIYDVEVSAVTRLTPHMNRITFTGETVAGFLDDGPDQRCKVMLPRAGQDRPVLTGGEQWYQDWLALPADVRPVMRTYTIRCSRPERAELDIDFVLHGVGDGEAHADTGPASSWATAAEPGQRVGIMGAYAEYDPGPETPHHLLLGDDTALPAIGAIIDGLGEDRSVLAILEVESPDDVYPLKVSPQVDLRWAFRSHGGSLQSAVSNVELPVTQPYVWLAGEASAVKAIRRHLVREREISADVITFMGYWRIGGSIDPD